MKKKLKNKKFKKQEIKLEVKKENSNNEIIENEVKPQIKKEVKTIHGSECGRNRPGFGWQAVSLPYNIIEF